MKTWWKNILINLLVVFCINLTMIGGCGVSLMPIELGHVFTGNYAFNPNSLNPFGNVMTDGNGIICTRGFGYADPDHFWGCGRKTFAAYHVAYDALISGKTEFSSNSIEVRNITYPNNWDSLSETDKKNQAHVLATDLAKTIGLHGEIYHELGTLWGFGVDYESSFSGEDLYSDAVGATLAMEAMDMQYQGKGKATSLITTLANNFIRENKAYSASECQEITKSVEGTYWVSRPIQRRILARHFDIGADGWIDPMPIPGYTDANMTRIKAPRTDYSNYNGFSMDLLVSPGAIQYGKARSLLGLDRQIRLSDHQRLMDLIKADLVAKGDLAFD